MKKYFITDGKRYFHTSKDPGSSRFKCGMCVAKGDVELCEYLKSQLMKDDVCGNETMIWKQDYPKQVKHTIVTVKCPNCHGTGTTECHMQDYPCHFCDSNCEVDYVLVKKQRNGRSKK